MGKLGGFPGSAARTRLNLSIHYKQEYTEQTFGCSGVECGRGLNSRQIGIFESLTYR